MARAAAAVRRRTDLPAAPQAARLAAITTAAAERLTQAAQLYVTLEREVGELQALGTSGLAWPPAAAHRLRQMAAVYDVLHANLAAARRRLADIGQPVEP